MQSAAAIIFSMAVLHKAEADMTEADVVKDIVAVLAQVRQGVEVVVVQDHGPVAVIKAVVVATSGPDDL